MKLIFLITLMTGLLWLTWHAQGDKQPQTQEGAATHVCTILGGIGILLLLRKRY